MRGLLAAAARRLRAGGRRSILSGVGIFLAAAMAGVAVTVSVGLGTGFDRAADAADLPDVIARFDGQPRDRIDELVSALPNVRDRAYRIERNGVDLSANGRSTDRGALNLVDAAAVVEAGRVTLTGPAAEIAGDDGVRRAYLGV